MSLELLLKHKNLPNYKALINLRGKLSIIDKKIDNLNLISKLTKIDLLELTGCGIDDIQLLSNLTNLSILKLNKNNIKNFKCLNKLTNLTHLEINSNCDKCTIYDINCIDVDCKKYGNYIIDDISDLINLKKLYLDCNKITEISENINKLTNLTILDISRNKISDLSPLSNMISLTSLNIMGNREIVDLSPLTNLINLTKLEMQYNYKIKDLNPLHKLIKLEKLNIDGTYVEDVSVLKTLPILRSLTCSIEIIDKKLTIYNYYKIWYKIQHPLLELEMFDNETVKLFLNDIDVKEFTIAQKKLFPHFVFNIIY